MLVSMILAVGNNEQIGLNNSVPWQLNDDMKFFKNITTNHVVIFGRKTIDSIGHALPNRINIVITTNKKFNLDGCLVYHSVEDALKNFCNENELFICGGAEIYNYCLKNKLINKVYITKVNYSGIADTYFDLNLLSNYNLKKIKSIEKNKNNNYSAEIFTCNIGDLNDK